MSTSSVAGFRALSEGQKDAMRAAGRIVGSLLAYLRQMAQSGINTRDLDEAAEQYILRAGGKPAFKGIYGYKYTICASENEKVVHGLPNRRKLQEGDILSIDLGAVVEGIYADAALTLPIGQISSAAAQLLQVTEAALWRAIVLTKPGVRVGDLGAAVQELAESHGYGVVRDFVGHGIGDALHMAPQIPNFGTKGEGAQLIGGMAVAIEPMINAGTHLTRTLEDKWTVVTQDRSLSCHFEHTVLVGEVPEVVTWEEGRDYSEYVRSQVVAHAEKRQSDHG